MKQNATAFLVAVVFAFGLGISQMTNPSKILGFLNVFGNWDPTLLVVFATATGVFWFSYRYILSSSIKDPLENYLRSREKIDKYVIIGSLLFGIGWGLIGICPGPALTDFASLKPSILLFLAGMISGMYGAQFFQRYFIK